MEDYEQNALRKGLIIATFVEQFSKQLLRESLAH